jgi:hypothetical protein
VRIYDSEGRVTSQTNEADLKTTTTYYDRYSRVIDPAAPPLPPPAEPLPEMESILQLFTHTFEFRLAGSEEKRRTTSLLPIPSGDRIVVTTDRVRTFVTRRRESAAAGTPIGSIEVRTERRPKTAKDPETLVCIAQATDFGPDDLVVVQVDITAWWVLLTDHPD